MSTTMMASGSIGDLLNNMKERPTKGSTAGTQRSLFYVDQDTTLSDACNIMREKQFSAIPILDAGKNKFVGMIDSTDICLFVAFTYAQKMRERPGEYFDAPTLFGGVKAIDLLPLSDEGKLCWSYPPNTNIEDIMEAFSKGIHRALIYTEEGDIKKYNLLSQRDAIEYLLASGRHKDTFNKRMGDLPALFQFHPALCTISGSEPAIHGFMKIGREHFTAVAVLDESGRVTASLRGSDLRSLNDDFLRSLLLPTSHFLRSIHDGKVPSPLTATPDDKFGDVVKKMLEKGEHHLWILDSQGNLSDVLTLSDVCRVFMRI